MIDRYTDRLFREILVPITGMEQSWLALEQPSLSQRKEARFFGLHVIPFRTMTDESLIQALQLRFNQRCQEADLPASLILEKGSVPRQYVSAPC